ncbi:DUF5959 family protein [Amycolatopsis sp. ATCC 39116]|uniref:DUF5959 family protein n=1 Tax=Amycolatopsis sp. (strain ATCC 39116 / 75iv2) TaxID=385957 RepID=UPI002100B117|nr:DUF5959 family protein [Amycolatopsis sp. ATCC 39116]
MTGGCCGAGSPWGRTQRCPGASTWSLRGGDPSKDGGRSPEIHLSGRESGSLVRVTVVDEPASGVSVMLELPVAEGWIDDHRARLRAVREAWPSEVVEASPGVYEWRCP